MTNGVKLPNEIRAVMDNGLPAVVVTCSADGIPNATIISHVHYVDESHIALSFQFFNKTIRNVRENPRACVSLNDVKTSTQWILDDKYDHSEAEGTIFGEMEMRFYDIATAFDMEGILK